jgi:Xaa-Pro aminopeptidase
VKRSDPAAERWARVQAAMARHGVGALCLATPHLAAFASGARRVQVAGSGGTMPWVVVAAGAPSAVVFTTDPDGVPPWMPRDAVEPLSWDRDRQVARIVALVGATRGAVACDVLAPPLRAALAGRTLVDAAALLAEAAAPRAASELAAIGRALAAARAGLRAAVAAIVPGATRADVHARFAEAMSGSGAGFPLGEPILRRAGSLVEADASLGAGDLVTLEVGVWVEGHAGVAGDTVACGGGDLAAPRRAWRGALCAAAKRCRAGTPVRELRAAAAREGARPEGLLAHGLGVGIEPPLVGAEEDDDGESIRAGAVLVLGPTVGAFRATRALVVTERSYRWLEPSP